MIAVDRYGYLEEALDMETFKTDAGYELSVNNGFDRDGELELEIETDALSISLYFNRADIMRLRNKLSIELGE